MLFPCQRTPRFRMSCQTSYGFLFLFLLLQLTLSVELSAATFTVINTNDSGDGSLRWAITNANDTAGSDIITFNIPGAGPFTIAPTNALPNIAFEPVVIDATTQPGYAGKPRVELVGTNAGAASGLHVLTPYCLIRGLAINRFTLYGIQIENAGSNTVEACFLGTGVYGTNSLGNTFAGLGINSPGNLIGGYDATNRNIISGSNGTGIFLDGAKGNVIVGNYIGTDVTGTKRLGNMTNGIYFNGGASNIVGGTQAGARNIISGNYLNGIFFGTSSKSNLVAGNYIGPNAAGTAALTNSDSGITISANSSYNVVGGTNTAARNIISGNHGRGILIRDAGTTGTWVVGNYIGTTASGLARLPNDQLGVDLLNISSTIIGGVVPGAGNLISGNTGSGVAISDSTGSGNQILGNYIGTDATGLVTLSNSQHGVIILNVSNNIVASNTISGNGQNGIYIVGTNATGNTVSANFIGTSVTGLGRVGNSLSGVRLESPGNTIGGTNATARNLISGNTNNGVYLFGAGTSNNLVAGNYIGTALDGTNALPNAIGGVGIDGAPRNQLGGTIAAARNIISGNDQHGIYIRTNSAAANTIQGNYVGTDFTGTKKVANGNYWVANGNNSDVAGGIDIGYAPTNQIGGIVSGAGNVISGNWRGGIFIGEVGASNNVIQGNFIGVQADGVSPLGNEWDGFRARLAGGASGTIIGGSSPGAGNVIAYTTLGQRSCVRIINGTSPNSNILVRGNSLYASGGNNLNGFAINLGVNGKTTPSLNDSCDTDTGANLLQNYPVLTSAASGGGTTRIIGTLNSAANTTYLLQFYSSAAIPPPGGFVQAETFLGDITMTTGGNCSSNYAFTAILAVAVSPGRLITTSATDPNNNTSEISTSLITNQSLPTLTYTATPASRAYGAANPAFSGTVTGFLGGDNQANATTGTLAFTTPATPASSMGTYAINGSGLTANNGNYGFVQAGGNATALTITPAPVTITSGLTANNKNYDGSTTATLSSNNVVLAGVVQADTNNVRLVTNGYSATFNNATAGNGKPVLISGLSLGGSAAGNYTLTQPTGLTANVIPTTFTVSGSVELQAFAGTNRMVRFVASEVIEGATNYLQSNDIVLNFSTSMAAFNVQVPTNTTHISAKTAWNLRRRQPVTFTSGAATVNFTTTNNLRGGDLVTLLNSTAIEDSNNAVTSSDYLLLLGNYLQSVNGNTAIGRADINGDGAVTSSDYLLLLGNYLTTGDTP